MAKRLQAVAQAGVGIRVAHDPGDPLITSHCPFCGSGQVVGRSDGTIECGFCGQHYIVRVQPAFPGMPQAPGPGGAPSDIGPDGGVLPPDAIGPDGLPVGGTGALPPGAEDDEDAPPFLDEGDGDGDEDDAPDGPPGDDDGPPPPKGDSKPSKKKGSLQRTYFGLDGKTVLTETQFIHHIAASLGLTEAAGTAKHILRWIEYDDPREMSRHLREDHGGFSPHETAYDSSNDPEDEGMLLGDMHAKEHNRAYWAMRDQMPGAEPVMTKPHVHRGPHGIAMEAAAR
jgi:hypothetical protein